MHDIISFLKAELERLQVTYQIDVEASSDQPGLVRIYDLSGCGDSAGVYQAERALKAIKAVPDAGDNQENWQAVWDALNELDPNAPWDFPS